ncbi:MAG: AbrB/MazE/SpoVT family DNA-binding domain-containing protein [Deltaproteobacteria bacterium]
MKPRVSEKGQVTIPKKIRDRLGIRPGQRLEFEARDGCLIARKAEDKDPVDALLGAFPSVQTTDEFLDQARGSVDLP